MNQYPHVVFKVGRRRVSNRERERLEQKKSHLERMWERHGLNILKRIEKACGIRFPQRVCDEGIEIWLQIRRREDGEYVGEMDETEPCKLILYLGRNETWKSAKAIIVHELIHCLTWQVYYYDLRRREVTLFEDYFADELLTSLVEKIVLGRKLTRRQCDDALNYAMSELKLRLGKGKRHRKVIDSLMDFMKGFQSRIRTKETDVLRERRLLINELASPLPSTSEDQE